MAKGDLSEWDALIKSASRKWNVPWRWIKAVALNESDYGRYPSVALGIRNPDDLEGSVSDDKLSYGFMQMTLSTAQWLVPGITARDLNNPAVSIDLGARYLRWLMDRPASQGGDREWVIRGYNGGPGWAVTSKGPAMTAVYYERFLRNLDLVMELDPGSEMEIG